MNKPCPAETGLLPNIAGITGAPVKAQAGCFNCAQGSARITSPLGPVSVALQALGRNTLGVLAKPIKSQMTAHLAAAGGCCSGKELVTVMAGANDVPMELNFIGTPLGAATPQGAVANVALAGATLGAPIKTEVLAKGAKRVLVLVLNVPDVTSGNLSAPSLPGSKIDVKPASQVPGGVNHMVTDHFAVDLPLSLPFRHDLVGAVAGVGKIGAVKVLPIAVFGQYRFVAAQAQFRAHGGSGVTCANFFGERGSGTLTGLTSPAGAPTRLSIDDRWGLTSELGLLGRINERWFLP